MHGFEIRCKTSATSPYACRQQGRRCGPERLDELHLAKTHRTCVFIAVYVAVCEAIVMTLYISVVLSRKPSRSVDAVNLSVP